MKNITGTVQKTTSLLSGLNIKQIIDKIDGDSVVALISLLIIAKTICYVSDNGGSLEISNGDTKVILNSAQRAA